MLEQRSRMLRRSLDLDHVGIEFRHLHGFADQGIEVRGFFVNHGGQFPAQSVVEPLILRQGRRRRTNRRQRCTQFVGQRIDERRTQTLALARSLHARACLDRDGPRQGNPYLRAYGRGYFARQIRRPPCHRTHGAHPHHQRMSLKPLQRHNCRMRTARYLAQIRLEQFRQLSDRRHVLIPILHVQAQHSRARISSPPEPASRE